FLNVRAWHDLQASNDLVHHVGDARYLDRRVEAEETVEHIHDVAAGVTAEKVARCRGWLDGGRRRWHRRSMHGYANSASHRILAVEPPHETVVVGVDLCFGLEGRAHGEIVAKIGRHRLLAHGREVQVVPVVASRAS